MQNFDSKFVCNTWVADEQTDTAVHKHKFKGLIKTKKYAASAFVRKLKYSEVFVATSDGHRFISSGT